MWFIVVQVEDKLQTWFYTFAFWGNALLVFQTQSYRRRFLRVRARGFLLVRTVSADTISVSPLIPCNLSPSLWDTNRWSFAARITLWASKTVSYIKLECKRRGTGKVRARMQASKPKYSISPCSSAKEKHGNRLRKEASRDREEVVHGYSAFGLVFTLSLQEPELRYGLGFVTFKSTRCLKDSHNYNDYNLLSHMGRFKTKFSFSGSAKWTGEILDDSFRHPAGYVEIFCGNCPHDMWQPIHKLG